MSSDEVCDRRLWKRWTCLERMLTRSFVEAAKLLPANPGPEEHALVNGFNHQMLKLFGPSQA
jgi:hypothetical protein